MKFLILLGLVFSLTAFAEGEARQAFLTFKKRAPNAGCAAKLDGLVAFRHLFTVKPFQLWLEAKGGKLVLAPSLSGWSTDLVTEIVQEIEQKYLPTCAGPVEIETVVDSLKAVYLESLGVNSDRFPAAERTRLFRALAVPRSDVLVIKNKLATAAEKGTVLELVQAAYGGSVHDVNGVWIFNANDAQLKTAQGWITKLCPGSPCAFWNPQFLWRVIVGPSRGVAAYVPEFGALVLSHELLTSGSELHHLVFVHELTHTAEGAAFASGEDWTKRFAAFSGWKLESGKWRVEVEKVAAQRLDTFAELSLSSPFSILPETQVIFGRRGKKRLDGFVFEKTYREASRRGDLSEDLADHVAAFHVAPQRFCFKGKNLAPLKAEWVRKQLFPNSKAIDCSRVSS